MYYPYFIAYIVIGVTVSLLVFFWALKNGQFRDQQRARFLPLRDEADTIPVKASKMHRLEVYVLFFLATAGLAASATVVLYALYFSK
jgi:cbb3-type cytochrome oxidase maturation protein